MEGARGVKTKEELLLTPLPPSFYKFLLWALFCLSSIIRHFTKSQGVCTWPLSTAKRCDKGYSGGSTAFIQLIVSSSLWEYGGHDRNTLESHFSHVTYSVWVTNVFFFFTSNICNHDRFKVTKTWKQALWFEEFPQTDPCPCLAVDTYSKPNERSHPEFKKKEISSSVVWCNRHEKITGREKSRQGVIPSAPQGPINMPYKGMCSV